MQTQLILLGFGAMICVVIIYDWFARDYHARKAVARRLAYDPDAIPNPSFSHQLPPSPDEIALAFAAALMTKTGDAMSAEAAVLNAWWAVPHYYVGRSEYVNKIVPAVFGAPTVFEPDFADEYDTSSPRPDLKTNFFDA